MGYRHYERAKIAPLFPFGHGLSYSSFAYSEPVLSSHVLAEKGKPITLSVRVTNTGAVAAKEIVQLYVRDVKSRLPRPEKELQGFKKVFLQPGESAAVEMEIDRYSVGYFDTQMGGEGKGSGRWVAEEGVFEVLVGASSADIR